MKSEVDRSENQDAEETSPVLSAIQTAVLQGDESRVINLVKNGVDINEQTTKDEHIICRICKKCICDIKDRSYNTASVSKFGATVDDSLDTDVDGKSGVSPPRTTDSLMKTILLCNGSVSSQVSSLSDTITVTFCCRTDCTHKVDSLTDVRTNVHLCKGSTILHLAVLMSSSKMVGVLLTLGAKVELENSQSHTVLHLSAKLDHVDMVKLLTKHGKDINRVNSNKDHVLHTAVTYSSPHVIGYILSQATAIQVPMINRFGKHPIHIAIQNNNPQVLKSLLSAFSKNTQINESNSLSNALHFAVIHNSTDCGQMLIDSGFDVDACDSSNTPLLRVASRFGLESMTSLLLRNGAKVHRTKYKDQGQSALDMALEMTYLDQMLVLLSAGATFYSRSEDKNNTWAIEQMDMKLCLSSDNTPNKKEKFLKLLLFGYQFSGTVLSLAKAREDNIGHAWDEVVQLILTFTKNPLPLQRLAANSILRTLYPNAWVSLKQLPLPKTVLEYVIQHQYSWD